MAGDQAEIFAVAKNKKIAAIVALFPTLLPPFLVLHGTSIIRSGVGYCSSWGSLQHCWLCWPQRAIFIALALLCASLTLHFFAENRNRQATLLLLVFSITHVWVLCLVGCMQQADVASKVYVKCTKAVVIAFSVARVCQLPVLSGLLPLPLSCLLPFIDIIVLATVEVSIE